METQNFQMVKMEKLQFFNALVTAPDGAVIVYKVTADSSLLQDFYIATFDQGGMEVVWGAGTTPEDALEGASKEYDSLLDPPERENNPFREVLMIFKDNKEERE